MVCTVSPLKLIILDILSRQKKKTRNISQRKNKLSSSEHALLTELLVSKDKELKETLQLAEEQAKINLKMEDLKAEVDRQDQYIQQLQRQLKEAEQILATAIYQAKQKLQSIAKANKRPVPSEELIKFAHRISASNAVCAPLTWQQGDPRRPYPTVCEMRILCLIQTSMLLGMLKLENNKEASKIIILKPLNWQVIRVCLGTLSTPSVTNQFQHMQHHTTKILIPATLMITAPGERPVDLTNEWGLLFAAMEWYEVMPKNSSQSSLN
ncbi:hypothetical protein PR048_006450 [Dryococelus australis]|uniref:Mediator of RNA polymerase II transcription subunit 4 n=1 Tax=Dryococelus australis TaxID=614101 RepID=A0ABQ9IB05_9NEOP|nr:hypothetical protein PR048_006450 [Dryococelus australis]